MPKPIIEVENLSKLYHLGLIGSTTIRDSLERWWLKKIGKEEQARTIGAKHLMIAPDDPQAGPEPNTLWSLKDISFKVERGEVLGVIGKNGAGKSTLLKILSHITEPTTGRAIIRGRHASMLEVGTGFHPELTGKENIYLNGTILGMRKSEITRKFGEIVSFAEIGKFIDTPVKRYSSGMYVRLAFAVAAHLEPEILIVDEVLAVGDIAFQKKCLGKMGDVAKEGRTILFVSHNMAAVENLCPKAILLDKGSVQFYGETKETISKYLSSISTRNISLGERQDRFCSNIIKVTSIEFKDENENVLEIARSGQTLKICLNYDLAAGNKLSKIVVKVGLRTNLDVPVFMHSSMLTETDFGEIHKNGSFVFTIDKLPLPPGSYKIFYYICRYFAQGQEEGFDYIADAAELQVVEGKFYESGHVPPLNAGIFLVEGRWEIRQS